MSSKKKGVGSTPAPAGVALPALGSPRQQTQPQTLASPRKPVPAAATQATVQNAQSSPKGKQPQSAVQPSPRTKPTVPSLPVVAAATPIQPGFIVAEGHGDGVRVTKVTTAASSGLQVGDVIQSISGGHVFSLKDYQSALNAAVANGRLVLKVLREAKSKVIAVEYGPKMQEEAKQPIRQAQTARNVQQPQPPSKGSQTARAAPTSSNKKPAHVEEKTQEPVMTSPRKQKLVSPTAGQQQQQQPPAIQPTQQQQHTPAPPAATPQRPAPPVAKPQPPQQQQSAKPQLSPKPQPPQQPTQQSQAAKQHLSPKPLMKVLPGRMALHQGEDVEVEEEVFEDAPSAAEIARAQAVLAAAAKAQQAQQQQQQQQSQGAKKTTAQGQTSKGATQQQPSKPTPGSNKKPQQPVSKQPSSQPQQPNTARAPASKQPPQPPAPNTARSANTKPAATPAQQKQQTVTSAKKPAAAAPPVASTQQQQPTKQAPGSIKKPAQPPAPAPASPAAPNKKPIGQAAPAPAPASPAASNKKLAAAPAPTPASPASSNKKPSAPAATPQQPLKGPESPVASPRPPQRQQQQQQQQSSPPSSKQPTQPAATTGSHKKPAAPAVPAPTSPAASNKKPSAAPVQTSPPASIKKSVQQPSAPVAASPVAAKKPTPAPVPATQSPPASHKKPTAATPVSPSPPAATVSSPKPAVASPSAPAPSTVSSPKPSPRKTTVIVPKKTVTSPPPEPAPVEDTDAPVDLDEAIEGEEEPAPPPAKKPAVPRQSPAAIAAAAMKKSAMGAKNPKVQGGEGLAPSTTGQDDSTDEPSSTSPPSFNQHTKVLTNSSGLSITGSAAPTPRQKKAKPIVSEPSADDVAYYKSAFLVLPDEKDLEPKQKKAMVRISPTPRKSPKASGKKKKVASEGAPKSSSSGPAASASPNATKRPMVQRSTDSDEEEGADDDPPESVVAQLDSRAMAVKALLESVSQIEAAGVEQEKKAVEEFVKRSEAEKKKLAAKGAKEGSKKKKQAAAAVAVANAASPSGNDVTESKEDGGGGESVDPDTDTAVEDESPDEAVEPTGALSPPKERGSLASLRPTGHSSSKSIEFSESAMIQQKHERAEQLLRIKRTRSMDTSAIAAEGGLLAFAKKQQEQEALLQAEEAKQVEALRVKKESLDQARAKLNAAKRYLGLEIVDHPASSSNEKDGVRVLELKPDGSALLARLQVGDIILSLNGVDTPTRSSFGRTLKSLSVGSTIPIKFRRPAKRRGLADQVKTGKILIGTLDLSTKEVEQLNAILEDEPNLNIQLNQLKSRSSEQHSERVVISTVTLQEVHAAVFEQEVSVKSEVKQLESQVQQNGDVELWKKTKVHLGLELVDVTDRTKPGSKTSASSSTPGAALASVESAAVKVSKVFPGEAAEKAGIKVNDLIIMVNSHATSNRTDFEKILRGTVNAKAKPIRPGDILHFIVMRTQDQKKGPGVVKLPLLQFELDLQVGALGMSIEEALALRKRVEEFQAAKTKLEDLSKRSHADQAAMKQEKQIARSKRVQAALSEDTDGEEIKSLTPASTSPRSLKVAINSKSPTKVPTLAVGAPVSPAKLAHLSQRHPSIVPEFRDGEQEEPLSASAKPKVELIDEDEEEST